MGDTINGVSYLNTTFEMIKAICKLIKRSPKKEAQLNSIKEKAGSKAKGIHTVCPTRWTVRREACTAIISNYTYLNELWDESLGLGPNNKNKPDSDTRAKILGAQTSMKSFKFLFGIHLNKRVLERTDMLAKRLQGYDVSAAEGAEMARTMKLELEAQRCDSVFDQFWDVVEEDRVKFKVDQPTLPRNSNHEGPKELYRSIYFETYDSIAATITERFDQEDFNIYQDIQEVFLKAIKGIPYNDELERICQVYKEDISYGDLCLELPMFVRVIPIEEREIYNVAKLFKFLKGMSRDMKLMLSGVTTLAKLMLVMPATNAESERIFSALKRIKTYMRSTTSDDRLNHIMAMHVHKERLDNVDLIKIANQFAHGNSDRERIFGRFIDNDIAKKKKFTTQATQTM